MATTGQEQNEALKKSIVELNTSCADLLRQGRHREATSGFLDALQSSQQLLRQSPLQHDLSDDTMDYLYDEEGSESGQNLLAVPIHYEHSDTTEGIITVFSQSLVINDVKSFDAVFERNQDIIPCLLLFNVGLSLQIEGTQNGNDKLISKALRSYDTALTLLDGMTRPLGADGVFLLLAILNNVACIQAERFNLEIARRYMRLILDVLENQMFSDLLCDAAFDFFVLFLFLTPEKCFSAAPIA